MGLAPGLLPGRVTLDAGRDWFAGTWPTVPAAAGLDTEGVLRAAADGRIDVLVLLGADPLADFPDLDLAERALAGARTIIVGRHPAQRLEPQGRRRARRRRLRREGRHHHQPRGPGQLALAAGHAPGHRPPRLDARRRSWPLRLGADLGFTDAGEVLAEIGRVAPSHLGLTAELVNATPDGVLLPLPAEAEPAADDAEVIDGRDRPPPPRPRARPPTRPSTPTRPEATTPSRPSSRRPTPALVTFAAGAPGPVPPLDAYAFRLVATRKLYDQGTLVQASSQLSGLAPAPPPASTPTTPIASA